MNGKSWLQRTLFSGLVAVALIIFGSFVAASPHASAAASPTARISLLVMTSGGPIHIPVDGKPHLIQQLHHSCRQDPSGCESWHFIKAQLAVAPPARGTNALAAVRPMYACPTYLQTWNWTEDYSSWGHIEYYHVELDTEEYINPCYYTLSHVYTSPWCSGYNGEWCDVSSSGSYWDPGASLQRSWYQQNVCINTGSGNSCSTLRLQTNVEPDGGLTCSISGMPSGDPWSCGPL